MMKINGPKPVDKTVLMSDMHEGQVGVIVKSTSMSQVYVGRYVFKPENGNNDEVIELNNLAVGNHWDKGAQKYHHVRLLEKGEKVTLEFYNE